MARDRQFKEFDREVLAAKIAVQVMSKVGGDPEREAIALREVTAVTRQMFAVGRGAEARQYLDGARLSADQDGAARWNAILDEVLAIFVPTGASMAAAPGGVAAVPAGVAAAPVAPVAAPSPALPVAGWYVDPLGRHEHRYWSGAAWTENVANAGVLAIDQV